VKRLQRGRLYVRHLWREYKPYPVLNSRPHFVCRLSYGP
jgi:hypothetical protein